MSLQPDELETYAWQIDVPEFGVDGQEKLREASVLVSRCGGLGGVVAYELAAAGIGRLILAHGGEVKPSDLNRQLLMTHAALGTSRVASAERRLRELNPRLDVVAVGENVSAENVRGLVEQADLVVDAAPLFEERFLLNAEIVRQNKPMVECAMFDLQAQITIVRPGRTPCLECLVPELPPFWQRRFPVFGAVSGTVGCLAAMEVIKLVAGIGDPLEGRMLLLDLRAGAVRSLQIRRRAGCSTCGALP
jgi:molybdopterin/thiamine biosynthesis adenylyltransferase